MSTKRELADAISGFFSTYIPEKRRIRDEKKDEERWQAYYKLQEAAAQRAQEQHQQTMRLMDFQYLQMVENEQERKDLEKWFTEKHGLTPKQFELEEKAKAAERGDITFQQEQEMFPLKKQFMGAQIGAMERSGRGGGGGGGYRDPYEHALRMRLLEAQVNAAEGKGSNPLAALGAGAPSAEDLMWELGQVEDSGLLRQLRQREDTLVRELTKWERISGDINDPRHEKSQGMLEALTDELAKTREGIGRMESDAFRKAAILRNGGWAPDWQVPLLPGVGTSDLPQRTEPSTQEVPLPGPVETPWGNIPQPGGPEDQAWEESELERKRKQGFWGRELESWNALLGGRPLPPSARRPPVLGNAMQNIAAQVNASRASEIGNYFFPRDDVPFPELLPQR